MDVHVPVLDPGPIDRIIAVLTDSCPVQFRRTAHSLTQAGLCAKIHGMMKQRLKIPCIPFTEDTMGILQSELLLRGSHGQTRRVALFDSGASYSIIRRDIAETLAGIDAASRAVGV
jgi:hypothetical protein